MAFPHIPDCHASSRGTSPLFCTPPAQEIPVSPNGVPEDEEHIGVLKDKGPEHCIGVFKGREHVGRIVISDPTSHANIQEPSPVNPQSAGASKTRILESFPLDLSYPTISPSELEPRLFRQHRHHGQKDQLSDMPITNKSPIYHPDISRGSEASERTHLSTGNTRKSHPATSLSRATSRPSVHTPVPKPSQGIQSPRSISRNITDKVNNIDTIVQGTSKASRPKKINVHNSTNTIDPDKYSEFKQTEFLDRQATLASCTKNLDHPESHTHTKHTPERLSGMASGRQAHRKIANEHGKAAKKRPASPLVSSRTVKRPNMKGGFVISSDESGNDDDAGNDGDDPNTNSTPMTRQPPFLPSATSSLQVDVKAVPGAKSLPTQRLNKSRLKAFLGRNKSASTTTKTTDSASTAAQKAPQPIVQKSFPVPTALVPNNNSKAVAAIPVAPITPIEPKLQQRKLVSGANAKQPRMEAKTNNKSSKVAKPKSPFQAALEGANRIPVCVSGEKGINRGKNSLLEPSAATSRQENISQPHTKDQSAPMASLALTARPTSKDHVPVPARPKAAQAQSPKGEPGPRAGRTPVVQNPTREASSAMPSRGSIQQQNRRAETAGKKCATLTSPLPAVHRNGATINQVAAAPKKHLPTKIVPQSSVQDVEKEKSDSVAVAEHTREHVMPLKQAITNKNVVSLQQGIPTEHNEKKVEKHFEGSMIPSAGKTALLQRDNVKVTQREGSPVLMPERLMSPPKQMKTTRPAVSTPPIPPAIPRPVTPPTSNDLVLLPYQPTLATPYFEYSVFQKSWSTPHDQSSAMSTEITVHPFTDLDLANAQAKILFKATRTSLGYSVEEQSCKRDENGCMAHSLTHAHPFSFSQKSHVQFFVQRHEVSRYAGRTVENMEMPRCVPSTAYAVSLYKLVSNPNMSDDDDDDDDEAKPGDRDEALIRTPHPHSSCPNVYTALSSANRAAFALQVRLSHEVEPKNPMTKSYQERDLIKLNEKLAGLDGEGGESGRAEGYWHSKFNGVGLGGDRLEIVVDKVRIVGPRNL